MKLKHLLLSSFLPLLLLSGCASKLPSGLSRTERCQTFVENARVEMAAGRYFNAREILHGALSDCSGTGFLEEGQFLLAESYFAENAWLEARGEYSSFVRYYPSSPFAETAAYKKALSGLQMPFVLGRDQNYTDRAMEDFQTFLTDFPSSSKIDSAQIHLKVLGERKAESSFSIARLYYRMDESQAAAIALKDFLKDHPASERVKEARDMLLESYISLKQFAQAEQWLSLFLADPAQTYPAARAEKVRGEIDKAKLRLAASQKREKRKTKERVEAEE